MGKQILVPLNPHDCVEELLPHVERVAQPGMRVVFLLRYPVDGFVRFLSIYPKLEGGFRQRAEAGRELAKIYSWEGNRERAGKKISRACEVLEQKGAEVAVDVYTGSLSKIVKSYTTKNDVHLIVKPAGIASRIGKFLRGSISVTGWFKHPGVSPAVLIHPSTLR